MSRPCMSVNATTTVSTSPLLTAGASCSFVSIRSPKFLGAAAASPRDEALEELAGPGQSGGELLPMTLNRDDQAVAPLDPFHGPVLAVGGLLQAFGRDLDAVLI